MKTVTLTAGRPVFQGDVMIRRVSAVPAGFAQDTGPDARVVAHSETGHNHVLRGECDVFRGGDGMTCYASARSALSVVHLRDFDTHETVELVADEPAGAGDPCAVYEFRRQREWTPEGWRRVED